MKNGARRKLGFRRVVEYWLSSNAALLGLPLMILGVIALLAVLVIPLLPTGPVRQIEGEITGMGVQEDYEGSFTSASVRVEDETVRVRLPIRHGCRIGDRIKLRQRPTRWGHSTDVAVVRWPCTQG